MGAAIWTVVILLLVWVILRDRFIWPKLFGNSAAAGAPSLIDNVEFSWLPDGVIKIYKEYMPKISGKLKIAAKKAWTKDDEKKLKASMEMILAMVSDSNFDFNTAWKDPPNTPVDAPPAQPGSTTSGYQLPFLRSIGSRSGYEMPPKSWFMVTH